LNAILDDETARRAGWPLPALADAYLAGGARFLQVRCKTAPGAAFLDICEQVVARAHAAGALVVVNDRADIAALAGADGVHVGQEDLEPGAVRRLLGPSAGVGLSTHSLDHVRAAVHLPVDYIAVGPVFGTSTKQTGYAAAGTQLVSGAAAIAAAESAPKPIVAIGGITLTRALEVIRAGAASVAVISDLLSTGDPEGRVREYLRALA
jgi:thiamine-phosphate pyrophosphorylase